MSAEVRRLYERTLKVVFFFTVSGTLMASLLSGCAATSTKKTSPFQAKTSMQVGLKIDSDLRTLRTLSEQLDETRMKFIDLHKSAHC